MANAPTPQGSRNLVQDPLPDIRFDNPTAEAPLRTRGPTLSSNSVHWDGEIYTWNTFTREVENKFSELRQVNCLDYSFQTPPPLQREHYICGEEKGIEARFIANALNVMSCVAWDQDKNVLFGDFRSTRENQRQVGNRKYPDFAGMTGTLRSLEERHRLRFVGEAKADWTDKLVTSYESATRSSDEGVKLCDWLRQLAHYMALWELRYGFITTYRHTMFVKYAKRVEEEKGQEKGKKKEQKKERDVILVSPPIAWATSPNDTNGAISVRQAIWFLMHESVDTGTHPWKYRGEIKLPEGAKLLYTPTKAGNSSDVVTRRSDNSGNAQAHGGAGPSSSKNAGVYEEHYGRQTFRIDPGLGTRISDQKMRHLRSLNEVKLSFQAPTRKKEAFFWVEKKDKTIVRVEPEDVTFYRGLRMLTLSQNGAEVVRLTISDKTMKDLCSSNMDVSSFMRRHIASCGR